MTGDRANDLSMLFTGGERLGWVFRDRRQFHRPYPEPEPAVAPVPDQLHGRAISARNTSTGLMIAAIVLWVLFLCVPGSMFALSYQSDPVSDEATNAEIRVQAIIVAVTTAILLVAAVVPLAIWRSRAGGRVARFRGRAEREFQRAHADWSARRAAYEQLERQRVDQIIEWGAAAASPGARRIDVVGGNLWGWEALLTVFGASALATRGGLTLVDLSGEAVGGELVALAADRGIAVDVQDLPTGQAESDLLVGLDRARLVSTVVEAMHGGAQRADRATRSVDHRLLDQIVGALGEDRSMTRVVAAVRVAMGEPGPTPELTEAERSVVADELFSDDYRRGAHEHLRRIESFLYPLRELGARAGHRPTAPLTCIAVTGDGGAHGELLKDLVVQWLAHRITAAPDTSRTLVIAGADDLHRGHIERIADICDRRSVRLMLLFRHLREASLHVLGAGSVAFMKLGNHEEATRAADFIGRQHKFVLTSVTSGVGGSQTHTTGTSDTFSRGHGGQYSMIQEALRLETRQSWNSSRSWGTSQTYAETTQFNSSESTNRVYEYTVEPRTLQDLPDYAMLLVESSPLGPVLRPVECNPEIVTLPRASVQALPEAAAGPAPAAFAARGPAHQQGIR